MTTRLGVGRRVLFFVALGTLACGGGGPQLTSPPSPTFTVIYSGNGSAGGTAPTDNIQFAAGAQVTVLGNSGNLAKSGYTFATWNTDPDGSGTEYAPGAQFNMSSANVTLYAQWNGEDWPVTVWGGAPDAIVLKAYGTVWTWGGNRWSGAWPGCGMLGDGTTQDQYTPEQVPGLSGALQAFGGDGHTAVLLQDGTVWTFGANGAGQLGIGTITGQSLVPVQVQGLTDVIALTARDFHNQALRPDGTIWSWGSGPNGELGNGTIQDSPTPVQVNPF